jgi:hypothetical protein
MEMKIPWTYGRRNTKDTAVVLPVLQVSIIPFYRWVEATLNNEEYNSLYACEGSMDVDKFAAESVSFRLPNSAPENCADRDSHGSLQFLECALQ